MPLGIPRGARCVQRFDDSLKICNSHYLSHFAAFFIDARAKRSVVESCISLSTLVKAKTWITFKEYRVGDKDVGALFTGPYIGFTGVCWIKGSGVHMPRKASYNPHR